MLYVIVAACLAAALIMVLALFNWGLAKVLLMLHTMSVCGYIGAAIHWPRWAIALAIIFPVLVVAGIPVACDFRIILEDSKRTLSKE
jgi:biotin transporter BioY